MLVLNLPFKALMFLTLMRPSLVLFLVLWLRSEERFSRNAETDLVCRLLLEKKNKGTSYADTPADSLTTSHTSATAQTSRSAIIAPRKPHSDLLHTDTH